MPASWHLDTTSKNIRWYLGSNAGDHPVAERTECVHCTYVVLRTFFVPLAFFPPNNEEFLVNQRLRVGSRQTNK